METTDRSSHVGRALENPDGHPAGRESDPTNPQQDQGRQINRQAGEDGKAINKAREAEKTTPQADSAGDRGEDKPRQPEDSAASGKDGGEMKDLLQGVLVALERQRADNASFRADVTKQLADQTKQLADQTKQLADQQADFVDRDAARAKETANLRAETARGFQHMTMWLAGVLLGIFAVLVAVVGVGIQLIDKLP